MLVVKLIVCLLILYKCGCSLVIKSCSDCKLIRQCPNVKNIPKEKITEKLTNSFCGRTIDNGKRAIKICCSDFAVPENLKLFSRLLPELQIIDDTNYDTNNIDNHTNIKLLPGNCGQKLDDRIVGGNETAIYEFPWMALIYHKDNNGHVILDCGGSVISSRYILTAAHCVFDKTITGVRVGDFNIRKQTYCQGVYPNYVCQSKPQELRVEKSIVHKEYGKHPNLINDIALLRVNKSIDFSLKNAKPICLPVWKEIRNINLSGKASIVAGWGLMDGGKRSDILQKVTIPIMPETECVNYFERDLNPKQSSHKSFCAGETGKDACNGDSGGPLMIFDEYKDNYRIIQYGIVSYGSKMCGYEAPGVYTDVSKYMKWILDNIEE
ncbi:unnamed protein product, partial [Brenthis ino]